MAYDFNAMGPGELRKALDGPTGDYFARQIADAAIELAEKSFKTNSMLAAASAAMETKLENCSQDLCREEFRNVGTFGWVLEGLQEGRRFARLNWNGVGMFIFLVKGSTITINREPLITALGEGKQVEYHAHIDLHTAQGGIAYWTPSVTDLFADDWEEV